MQAMILPFRISYLGHSRKRLSIDEVINDYSQDATEEEAILTYSLNDGKLTARKSNIFELSHLWKVIPTYFANSVINSEMNKHLDLGTGDIINEKEYNALEEIWNHPDKTVKWYYGEYANTMFAKVKQQLEECISAFDSKATSFAKQVGKRIEEASGILLISCKSPEKIEISIGTERISLHL